MQRSATTSQVDVRHPSLGYDIGPFAVTKKLQPYRNEKSAARHYSRRYRQQSTGFFIVLFSPSRDGDANHDGCGVDEWCEW